MAGNDYYIKFIEKRIQLCEQFIEKYKLCLKEYEDNKQDIFYGYYRGCIAMLEIELDNWILLKRCIETEEKSL